jgi:hypothetical protein
MKPAYIDEKKEPVRLKLKWSAKKSDPENGGYSVECLRELFHKVLCCDLFAYIVSFLFLYFSMVMSQNSLCPPRGMDQPL